MSGSCNQSSPLGLRQLADCLGIDFRGDADLLIAGVASLSSAGPNDLCFLQAAKYRQTLADSACGAAIVPRDFEPGAADGEHAWLFSDYPQRDFVRAIHCLGLDRQRPAPGIHPSAVVADSARLGDNVSIGALAVIGERVELGEGVVIGPGCVLEEGVCLGDNTLLHPNVTLGHRVRLGRDCIVHSGAVIGADGFGLVLEGERWIKVPQLGSVRIGDRVEIGANTTIDRGALDDTVIEDGVKLDNLIQVAHNVRIGENTAVAACSGFAGSAVVGRNCRISGRASVMGHLEIADGVTVTATALVTRSINEAGVYSSGTPLLPNREWRRVSARYRHLDEMAKRIADLERRLDAAEQKNDPKKPQD